MRRAEDWKSLSTPRWAMSGEGRPVNEQPSACRPPAAESVSVQTGHPLPTGSIPQAPDFCHNRDARALRSRTTTGRLLGPTPPSGGSGTARLRAVSVRRPGRRGRTAPSDRRGLARPAPPLEGPEGLRRTARSRGFVLPEPRRVLLPLAVPSSQAPAPAGQAARASGRPEVCFTLSKSFATTS